MLALAVLPLFASGCGGGDEQAIRTLTVTQPRATAPATTASPAQPTGTQAAGAAATTTTTTPPPDYGREAEREVRRYYALLNDRRFEDAWAELGPGLQAQLGPFERWRSGYDLTEGTRPALVDATSASSTAASVRVELHTDDLDVCGDHVSQLFSGTWQLTRSAGAWTATAANLEKAAGGDPVRDPALCLYWEPVAVPDDYEPPDSGFEYIPEPDPGEPAYDPPTDFCDSHDCIPNFQNGTGYPVQCADGQWSSSGGRPGACSWHGGIGP